ncbi:MAG: hypothetical protein WCY25_03220 [Moheibacter sp.]
MKNLLLLTLSILLFQNLQAQTPQIFHKQKSEIGIPNDFGKNSSEKTVPKVKFKDTIQSVILINKENITTDGYNFLIDIPITAEKNPIGIFINDEQIPVELFFERKSFLPGQNEIFLFTPDWRFHEKMIEEQKKLDIHIKDTHRELVYHIKRNNTGYTVDTLILLNTTKFIFQKTKLKENEVKFYYYDCYGSVCCPRDDRWDSYEAVQNKIKLFEEQNNLSINKDSNSFGEEGEHCTSYLLDDLTNEQKLLFIQEIKSVNKEEYPQIFHPAVIEP